MKSQAGSKDQADKQIIGRALAPAGLFCVIRNTCVRVLTHAWLVALGATSHTAEDLKSSGDADKEVAQISLKALEARLEDRGHMSDASMVI